MKQFTLFKAWLMLCLFCIVGVGSSWAETYTITFQTSSSDGSSTIASNTKVSDVVSAGASYVSGFTSSCSKAYHKSKSGVKLGTSNANGTVEFNIATNYQSNIKKITVKSVKYGSDTGTLTLYKGSTSLKTGITPGTDYTHTFTTATTVSSIKISTSSKRAYISEIVLETDGGSTATPLSVPTNLSSSNVTSTGATLTWDAVENASSYKVKIGSTEYDANTNSYSATELSASTPYTWSVKAIGDGTNYSSSDYAANANFTTAAPASHKAYFYVNGALQNNGGTSFAEGATITFPSDPADIEGKKFQGWTTTQNYSNATTAPSDMTKSATMGDGDQNWYAVFATAEGGDAEPTAYTAGQTGNYVLAICSNNKWYALPNNPTVSSGKIAGKEITVSTSASSVNFVTTSNASGYIWTIANVTNGQTISDGTNYIYHANGGSSGTNLAYGNSTSYTWKIESETTGLTFKGMSGSTVNSRGMLASGTTFGGYALSNEDQTGYNRIQVLPITGGVTYSDYTTTVATQYDVKFYVDGEEQTGLAQKVVEGGNPTAVAEPTKMGYTFDGWYEASDFSGSKIADVTSVTISADKNFYGRFNINNYTITYNNVEGATHSNPATYTIETATINLADASKDGYIFQGWFDNEGFTGDAVTTIAQGSTGNKTFWAKWTEIPANPSTVTFNVGEHGTCETASTTEETVGAGVALPEVTAHEGWVFKGWSTENPATAETIVSAGDDGKYHILANTTLYAYYKVKPATPTFSSTAGAIEKGTEVTISCTTEDANIYYTTNGDEPTAESTAYTEAITVSAAQTLKAIAILDGEQSEVATAAYTIAQHTAQFSINGFITDANNCTVANGEGITFPADPTAPEEHVFIGWKKDGEEVTTPQAEAIATVDKATEVMGTVDVTYYAVWAVGSGSGDASVHELTQEQIAAAYVGSGDNKTTSYGNYEFGSGWSGSCLINKYNNVSFVQIRKNNANNYILSPDFGGAVASITINTTASASTVNTLADRTFYLCENNETAQPSSGDYGSGSISEDNGSVTIDVTGEPHQFYIYANGGAYIKSISVTYGSGSSYSDYCTKVSLDPKPTIVLSATELAEYAGNTNTSITASVSEGTYTGALTVESSAEAVATASISEGTITINALTAGSATITVTAPEVTGFRKNTATIAVTVSEKLAHGLSFSADVLNLTVGDTEFSEPTLNNPNSLPIVYSLVYAKPENDGNVATINSETGKLALAVPSLSTETQGAVTVKATTVGDNSHAAGEVTYNLVVARKVTTTSWSNEGADVTIDKDEIATLPTASNNGERNLFYESSNENVATIDNTGAVTFVAYGTTTITVKTTATAEYAATSASYELTFAPRYTVTFNVNGEETVLREETTGAGVTAPSVEPIDGKIFRGWAENEIDGTTEEAPTFVTTATLDDDKTLYAVFATMSGSSTDYTMTIGYEDLSTNGYGNGNKSATATSTTDPSNTLTVNYSVTDVMNNSSKIQFKASSGVLYNTTDLGSITSVTLNTTSGTALTTYYGTTQKPTSGTTVGTGNGYFTVKAGSAWGAAVSITVAFTKSSYSYSGYCTTVKTTPTLSFAEATYNATVGETFDAPTLTNPQDVTVTYSSSDTDVATINSETGAVTLVGAGTTTITATFDGDARYNATFASYELVVGPADEGGTINFVATTGYGKYYATFSSTRAIKFDEVFVNEDETCLASVKAYAVAIVDGQICRTDQYEVNNDGNHTYIPANTGVLFEYILDEDSEAFDGAVPFEYADAEAEGLNTVADNMLVACPTTGACPTVEGTNYYYKLAYGDNTNKTKLGFWWGAVDGSGNFKVKAGGAVLVVPQSAGIRGFSFTPDGVLTCVNGVNNQNGQDMIYSLQGQRMLKLQRGVNIVNGRKIIR